MLRDVLGVKSIYCVIGFSMGGQQVRFPENFNARLLQEFDNFFQAYYWPVVYPDFVERYLHFMK